MALAPWPVHNLRCDAPSRHRGMCYMTRLRRLSFLAATFLVAACVVPSARAAEPPGDLCSLLPASEVSKILGKTYGAPQKSVAPRPYANTVEGTDCNYLAKDGSKFWFRIYVDPSPSVAADLFARLRMFYSPPTPVAGVGDEAYFDPQHAIHVRKGRARFYLNANNPSKEKELKSLAGSVAGRL